LWNRAADSGELAAALIPAVWTFLGVVVVTLGTIAVQALKSRAERSGTPASPGSSDSSLLQVARDVARDIGQLDQRANDNDERDDMQDRELRDQRNVLDEHHARITALERRYNDHRDPDWRRT
jgi:hypothetical protein